MCFVARLTQEAQSIRMQSNEAIKRFPLRHIKHLFARRRIWRRSQAAQAGGGSVRRSKFGRVI
jgi:hypothetical protein